MFRKERADYAPTPLIVCSTKSDRRISNDIPAGLLYSLFAVI